MKIISVTTICIVILMSSCINREPNTSKTEEVLETPFHAIETPIKLKSLHVELDNFIDFNDDSLTISEYKSASYWIVFFPINGECYVSIIDKIGYYDSRIMVGYFMHRDRYISVYGLTDCGEEYIDSEKLSKVEMSYLIDFAGDIPPVPHRDYGHQYLIKGDSLVLVKTGRVSRVPTQPKE